MKNIKDILNESVLDPNLESNIDDAVKLIEFFQTSQCVVFDRVDGQDLSKFIEVNPIKKLIISLIMEMSSSLSMNKL